MLPYVIKFSCSKVIKKLKIKHKLSTQAKKKTNPKDMLLLSTYSFWAVLQASWCECLGSIHFDWQLWSDMTTWVARERERLVLLLFPNGPSASLIRISGGGTQALEIEKKKKKKVRASNLWLDLQAAVWRYSPWDSLASVPLTLDLLSYERISGRLWFPPSLPPFLPPIFSFSFSIMRGKDRNITKSRGVCTLAEILLYAWSSWPC